MKKAIRIIYLNFFLLIALMFSTNPIGKAIDNLTDKYKVEANKKMCTRIAQKQEEYGGYISHIFISGCVYQTRTLLRQAADDNINQLANINKIFEEQDSLYFKKIEDACSDAGTAYVRQAKIQELIIKDLVEHFECEKLDWSKE